LAQHQNHPSTGHLEAAKHVVKYLVGTKNMGNYFTSKRRPILESFLHFPLPPQVLAMSDANWGPQDASITKSTMEFPLLVSRSMSAYFIDLLTGYQKGNQLLQAVQRKLKYTLLTNASSSYWN
jgi:hypothetical protein